MNLTYTFPDRLKKATFVLMGIGLIAMIVGFITDHAPEGMEDHYHHNRFWANLLLNTFFFMAIGLAATFFLALQYAAEAAWATTVKRVIEAVSCYLPIGAGIMLLFLILGELGVHHIYEFMDPEVVKHDELIQGKMGYLGPIFFMGRAIVYVVVWSGFQRLFRKRSLDADLNGDSNHVIHFSNMKSAAIFLVFFGVTSSTCSWDWIMSIDTHWFSTMFGWYTFSGMWITALITIILLTLHLKSQGYMEFVTESTIHDLGKWMFAISFLWTYLFFMQFMLIWYTNMPEEVSYYYDRLHEFGYRGILWGMFFTNFAFPMLFLMSRDAKRNAGFLTFVGIIITAGHYFDVYTMIMPAAVHEHKHFGFTEIGMFAGFLGLFVFIVLSNLAKAPLLVKNHPYLDESLHHST